MGILQVDNIIAQSTANTVTLGVSGNTINIPAGVTFNVSSGSITLPNGSVTNAQLQNSTITINGSVVPLGTSTTISTGVVWNQTVQTTNFTASVNVGYMVNTSTAAVTVTLPAAPSIGDQIQFVDFNETAATNNIILNPNGLKIDGITNNTFIKNSGEGVTLLYTGTTRGWIPVSAVNEGTQALSSDYAVDFLVVAGGASGGRGSDNSAGGGGAGGYRNSYSTETSGGGGSSEASLSFNPGTVYTITVGAGGAARTTDARGANGTDSSISGSGLTTITSTGGGGGGAQLINGDGIAGGSGGGACYGTTNIGQSGGAGTANQGYRGGNKQAIGNAQGAGGGGAGAQGVDCTANTNEATNGGAGLASSITGSSVTRAGGGAGVWTNATATGGSGGGGNSSSAGTAGSGTVNTGSGGGATVTGTSGAGGSGVVILRMATVHYTGTTSGSPTVTTSGSDTILTFNGSGTYTA